MTPSFRINNPHQQPTRKFQTPNTKNINQRQQQNSQQEITTNYREWKKLELEQKQIAKQLQDLQHKMNHFMNQHQRELPNMVAMRLKLRVRNIMTAMRALVVGQQNKDLQESDFDQSEANVRRIITTSSTGTPTTNSSPDPRIFHIGK